MTTIAELLAAVPAQTSDTTGNTVAELLGKAPDTTKVKQERKQSQTRAMADSMGVAESKIKEWTGGKPTE